MSDFALDTDRVKLLTVHRYVEPSKGIFREENDMYLGLITLMFS